MTFLPFLAAFEPERVGVFIPIIAIAFGCTIALVSIVSSGISRRRQEELWHETARVALEKGQPLPPRIEAEPGRPVGTPNPSARREKSDLRSGLILLSLGAGLFLAFGGRDGSAAYFAAIPGFIGLALLLNAAIEGLTKRSPDKSDNTAPKL